VIFFSRSEERKSPKIGLSHTRVRLRGLAAAGLLLLAAGSWAQSPSHAPATASSEVSVADEAGTAGGGAPGPMAEGRDNPGRLRISGKVVNAATGEPVIEAKVTVEEAGGRGSGRSVYSDDSGQFLFDPVPPGKYRLTAAARGFPSQAFEQHGAYFTAIAVGPRLMSEDLVFRLQPAAAITGRVTDDFGEPVREGQVLLFEEILDNGRWRTIGPNKHSLDSLGSFRFGNLHRGRYFLALSAKPWYAAGEGSMASCSAEEGEPLLDVAYPFEYYSGAAEAAAASPIVLQPGDQFPVTFTLHALPAVSLRVQLSSTEGGFSYRGVRLSRLLLGGYEQPVETPQREFSSRRGLPPEAVEFSGLAPGRYLLHAEAAGARLAEEIEVVADTEVRVQDVPAQVAVSGFVKWEEAEAPPSSAMIGLAERGAGRAMYAAIEAGGHFEFAQRVRPGRYDVFLSGAAGFALGSVSATGAKADGQMVQIGDSGPVLLNIGATRPAGRIDGIAVEDERPLSGAMVLLAPQRPDAGADSYALEQSDSDGTFALENILPGDYTLVAIKDGWGLEWTDPAALRPYLTRGQKIRIRAGSRHSVRLTAAGSQ
jgi:hypothetical protein